MKIIFVVDVEKALTSLVATSCRCQPSLGEYLLLVTIFVKMTINSIILDSGIRADCEVFGLFRDIIPVEALNGEEGLRFGRGRQGLLPDSRLELSGQSGGVGALGHVVKTKQNERPQILSEYRRTLSTTAERANSGCLLGSGPKGGGKEKGVGAEGGGEESSHLFAD